MLQFATWAFKCAEQLRWELFLICRQIAVCVLPAMKIWGFSSAKEDLWDAVTAGCFFCGNLVPAVLFTPTPHLNVATHASLGLTLRDMWSLRERFRLRIRAELVLCKEFNTKIVKDSIRNSILSLAAIVNSGWSASWIFFWQRLLSSTNLCNTCC